MAFDPSRQGVPRRAQPGLQPQAAARPGKAVMQSGEGPADRVGIGPHPHAFVHIAGPQLCDPHFRIAHELEAGQPALGFDESLIREIAEAGVPLAFDSLTEAHAHRTLALADTFSAGVALPARWRRSAADAERLRDGTCRVRLVKGEWADPAGDVPDLALAYLRLARDLAGRKATVAVATHDPVLAEAALRILVDAGTPCELEQLRGLPRCRTTAIARQLGVPVRLYYPFGPGWWPYAIDKALARPYLPLWALRDWLGA
jgi:proline dehydrogenase